MLALEARSVSHFHHPPVVVHRRKSSWNRGQLSGHPQMTFERDVNLSLVLSLVFACLAAINTIVLPVLAEPKFIFTLTDRTVAVAGATPFKLVADLALKFLFRHAPLVFSPAVRVIVPASLSASGDKKSTGAPIRR